jgi:hypothetical protein
MSPRYSLYPPYSHGFPHQQLVVRQQGLLVDTPAQCYPHSYDDSRTWCNYRCLIHPRHGSRTGKVRMSREGEDLKECRGPFQNSWNRPRSILQISVIKLQL